MTGFNRDQLIADLERDEGFVPVLYDDANGAHIGKGGHLVGNPTLGIGWAVALTPLSIERARVILGWHVDDKVVELYAALPWIADLSEARQRALVNMAFNLGVHGEQQFTTFLGLLKAGNYGSAADDLAETLWAKQVGQRAVRIVALIRNG